MWGLDSLFNYKLNTIFMIIFCTMLILPFPTHSNYFGRSFFAQTQLYYVQGNKKKNLASHKLTDNIGEREKNPNISLYAVVVLTKVISFPYSDRCQPRYYAPTLKPLLPLSRSPCDTTESTTADHQSES